MHLGISLIYLNETIPISKFARAIFVDKTISCIVFEQIKLNSYTTTIKTLRWTLIYTLKKIVAAYYNITIKHINDMFISMISFKWY